MKLSRSKTQWASLLEMYDDPGQVDGPDDIYETSSLTRRRLLLSVNERWRVRWDLFVMVLAIWNCFQLPFNIAFSPDSDKHPASVAVNACIDVLFLLDIFLNFRTTFLHP